MTAMAAESADANADKEEEENETPFIKTNAKKKT